MSKKEKILDVQSQITTKKLRAIGTIIYRRWNFKTKIVEQNILNLSKIITKNLTLSITCGYLIRTLPRRGPPAEAVAPTIVEPGLESGGGCGDDVPAGTTDAATPNVEGKPAAFFWIWDVVGSILPKRWA
uniref:Uncharacterized protein n=1 Tax=Romanomermis culicivorax TaxID=13658 RepID=A0A915IJ39_ROMCU